MDAHKWCEIKDAHTHRYFFSETSFACVLVNLKDYYITGHISNGDKSQCERFDTVEEAKRWVLAKHGIVTPRICPRCGYQEES